MKRPAHNAGSPSAPSPFAPEQRQKATITLAVLAAHAGLLAWLQASPGPVQPPELAVVTMELLASKAPLLSSQPAPPERRQPEKTSAKPVPKPAPQPAPKQMAATVAQTEPSPLPATASGMAAAATAGSSAAAAPAPAAATSGSGPNAPAPARVELPSASADYLNNPKPAYPLLSRRLREEGKVVLRVLIDTDGSAAKAEIRSSSGHERLDQAALQTVLRWRYVPARRNGLPEAMWFDIPVNFVLE